MRHTVPHTRSRNQGFPPPGTYCERLSTPPEDGEDKKVAVLREDKHQKENKPDDKCWDWWDDKMVTVSREDKHQKEKRPDDERWDWWDDKKETVSREDKP